MVIHPKSACEAIRDIIVIPTAHFAWANGLHMTKKLFMPVLLTGILVTEILDREIERTEISVEL